MYLDVSWRLDPALNILVRRIRKEVKLSDKALNDRLGLFFRTRSQLDRGLFEKLGNLHCTF